MSMNEFSPELVFDDPGLRGPKGQDGDAPSLGVAKVAPYLYKVEYKDWDYLYAILYAEEIALAQQGSSSVFNGTIVGHNADESYDDRAEFVIKTIASKGRHASIGMASIPSYLMAQYIDSGVMSEEIEKGYNILPFLTTDGMNDAGVVCTLNSIPNDYGRTTGTYPGTDDMPEFCLVRYVLDNAGSVEEAITLIDNVNIYMPVSDEQLNEYYLMISDNEKAVRVDIVNNRLYITEYSQNSIIIGTNFRLFGYDGTDATLQPHANGVERFRLLAAGYHSANTEAGMIDLLKSVRYTRKYDKDVYPFWYSDYRKDWTKYGWTDLTKDSPLDEYELPVQYSIDQFAERQRDGQTMHTVHTAVYDTTLKRMTVLVQEDDTEHKFCIDLMPVVEAETERATTEEEDIRNELHQGYYTKAETDEALSDMEAAILQNVDDNYYNIGEINALLNGVSDEIAYEHTVITRETEELLLGKMDIPENDGSEGQMLVKTETGHEWENVPQYLPEVTVDDNDKIMAVEDGEWVLTDKFADFIRYVNLTVNITADDGGVCPGGLIITVKNADTGDLVNSAEYKGQPVTFRVPRGLLYLVEQSGSWEGYHNPTPDYIEGAATTDQTLIFTYEAIKIPQTLRELEIIVNSGNASSLATHTGLQFEDKYEENGVTYDIIWDLKAVIPVLGEDEQHHMGVVLEWHYSTPTAMPFDAPERVQIDPYDHPYAEEGLYYYGLTGTTYRLLSLSPGDPIPKTYDGIFVNEIRSADASIIRRGYSKYSDSAVRKWLNSDKTFGRWFEPSHVGDAPPAQADTLPGFKLGCSEQILRMAKPVVISTSEASLTDYQLCDQFFIPSVTEVYGVNDNAEGGTPWQDWIDATGFDNPSNSACVGRKVYAPGTTAAQQVGLRTANVGYQYITWDVKTDGSLDGYANASASRRYTPCCVVYK